MVVVLVMIVSFRVSMGVVSVGWVVQLGVVEFGGVGFVSLWGCVWLLYVSGCGWCVRFLINCCMW